MDLPGAGRFIATATVAVVLTLPDSVRAQNAEEAATAEALFREGRALMSEGQHKEACAKFAASQRLDPSIGTLLNLADCNERTGKTASAWAQFLEAETLSRRAGSERRERVARERAAALEPRLIRLTIIVPERVRVAGLKVKRDDAEVDPAAWSSGYPVDPGRHVIIVTAPGKREWRTTIEARQEGERIEVTVPSLGDAPGVSKRLEQPGAPASPAAAPTDPATPAAPAAPAPAPLSVAEGSDQRAIGLVIGGVGLVALAAGSVFGLSANSKWSDADCSGGVCSTPSDQQLSEEANRNADIATVSFIAGSAVLTLGVVVYLTAPTDPEQLSSTGSVRVTPAVGPRLSAVAFAGHF